MSAVDPPSLLESRMATSLWESPFPTSLNGSDDVPPPVIERYSIFAFHKVLAGLNPLTCVQRNTWALSSIEAMAKFMTLYSTRTDEVHTTGWRWNDPGNYDAGVSFSSEWGDHYTASFWVGAHNVPFQSGYRSPVITEDQYSGDVWLGVNLLFGGVDNDMKSDFTSVCTQGGMGADGVTDTSYAYSDSAGSFSMSLSGAIDVGTALGSVCSAFVASEFWWGDDPVVCEYNDFFGIVADGQFVPSGIDITTLPSCDGALTRIDAASAGAPYSTVPYLGRYGLSTSGVLVSAFTGWSVFAEGGNAINLVCSRCLARHNSPTPLGYWVGRLRCSSFGEVEVHVVAMDLSIAQGITFGLHQDVDIPMPSGPTVPLANNGTVPWTGDFNFVVIDQTPSAWATMYGVTLIYD